MPLTSMSEQRHMIIGARLNLVTVNSHNDKSQYLLAISVSRNIKIVFNLGGVHPRCTQGVICVRIFSKSLIIYVIIFCFTYLNNSEMEDKNNCPVDPFLEKEQDEVFIDMFFDYQF